MMKAVFLGLIFVLAGLARAADYELDDGVAVLTTANFDSVVNNQEIILVEFYAPWCGHCKSLAPEYAQAATALKDKMILAKVDATVESDLASRFGVRGYPTLKIFRNGVPSDYNGGRTKDTIISYLEKQMMPACTTLASADEVTAFRKNGNVAIGFFGSNSGDAYTTFESTVTALRDDYTFGEVFDASVATSIGVAASEFPVVKVFTTFGEPVAFTGDLTVPALSAFVRVESLPLLDEVSRDNYKAYMDTGLPLAFIFIDPSDTATKASLEPEFLASAKTFRGRANFVWCDGVKFKQQAQALGLSGEVLPSLGLLNIDNNDHYAFAGQLNDGEVSAWLSSFFDGSLAPTIKSEPVPTQDGPVYVLVGSTFEDIAKDKSKDVLVEFYAPWCGHCKKLAPIYDELGEKFKNVDSVVIAKMDATANDPAGVAIQGFPTIKFFPANSDKVMDFNGDRSVDGFVDFIKNNAGVPFSFDGAASSGGHDEL